MTKAVIPPAGDSPAHMPYTATPEQIAEWKKKYGDIFVIKIPDNAGNDHQAYFKKPGRKELSLAMAAGKDNPMKLNDSLFQNAWLAGDEIIKTDDSMYLAACGKISAMVEVKEAEIVKL